ncbi:MAG: hypothetical protein WBE14_18400 [Xanthobacteraceae bacterium]
MFSITSLRESLLAAVPPQIFAAIKAGVGGLLVKFALTTIGDVALTKIDNNPEPIGYQMANLNLPGRLCDHPPGRGAVRRLREVSSRRSGQTESATPRNPRLSYCRFS